MLPMPHRTTLASGELSSRVAAPGRPKQGPTLSEGRSAYPASGELSSRRVAAPGRPEQGPTLQAAASPARRPFARQGSSTGRSQSGLSLSEGRSAYPASGELS